ncbi:orotate phosphoribosyltransferase [Pseudomonas antarctica]|uniref:orotate phosphoribosyltransferase n=1 Tax=Pseudomonas antarctica TaxID=219572 RepID=UPI00387B2B8A
MNSKQLLAKFIVDEEIIRFGSFKLKSGRLSPYFFNFGGLSDAGLLFRLANYYAAHIKHSGAECYDVLFGPAYKGIPLVVSTAIALSKENAPLPYAFNRKEAKAYADGGLIVGSDLNGKKVLAVDDVITSGRTIQESKAIVEGAGGQLAGYLVALDRCEKMIDSDDSAVSRSYEQYGVQCTAVSDIWAVLNYMRSLTKHHDNVGRMEDYLDQYAATPVDASRGVAS